MNHPKCKVYKAGDRESDKSWYSYCQRHQVPYIKVELRTKLANVEFDYITFNNKKIDTALQKNEERLRKRTYEIAEQYKNERTKVTSAGWSVIKITNINIEDAENVATEIYELVSEIIGSSSA